MESSIHSNTHISVVVEITSEETTKTDCWAHPIDKDKEPDHQVVFGQLADLLLSHFVNQFGEEIFINIKFYKSNIGKNVFKKSNSLISEILNSKLNFTVYGIQKGTSEHKS